MELELIKNNIEKQINVINKIAFINDRIIKLESSPVLSDEQKRQSKLLLESLNSLFSQLEVINNSFPELIEGVKFYKNLNELEKQKKISSVVKVSYNLPSEPSNESVVIKKADQEKFVKSVAIYQNLNKKLDFKDTSFMSPYITLSNKIFRDFSLKLLEDGYFGPIKGDLRKIASNLLADTYISLMFLFTSISLIFSILFAFLIYFLDLGILPALICLFGIPFCTFFLFFIYPSSKRKSLEKDINQELPFMTIYLAAISTSGIEPSKIFDILILSEDYPAIKREIKKLTNYVNFYGYDLVSALKIVSKNCPSERLSMLFDGLATTITSGGDLTVYLNKHAESLLFDYRLEREKYTRLAETFMNIYISIVIAAPMILLVLFILMSLAHMGINLRAAAITSIIVLIVGLLNIGFLIFLNAKQPRF